MAFALVQYRDRRQEPPSIVRQIADAEFDVSASLSWIDLTGLSPQPEVSWTYDGRDFIAPPAPPPPATNEERIDREIDGSLALLGLVRKLAKDTGMTEAQYRAAIRQESAS